MNGEARIIKHKLRHRYTAVAVFFALCFSVLAVRLFVLQVLKYDEYKKKSDDNIMSETPLKAERGIIYDRNMIPLASNVTSWRVFISPRDIKSEAEAALIADGLSEILGVDRATVLSGALNNKTRDRTIKKKASEEEKNKVIEFVLANKLSSCVHTEAGNERYYPFGSLACHVIGFMGTDSGLLGLEAYYDEYLKGEDGKYITMKNASGETLSDSFDTYIEATAGCDLITTIDLTLQSLLETQLENTYSDSLAANRVTGIVMEPDTGAVLAMATYPSFDLNCPYTLDKDSAGTLAEKGLIAGSNEYRSAYNGALYAMWNNKAVSGLYEPGSTFKIITTSVALETGVTRVGEGFFCSGALKVEGYGQPIRCHKRQGHGSLNFAEALQKSCNPTMMTLAARIGNKRFMDYFISFGYTGKTGIDLPGEALGIFHKPENFNTVELAVYSFGQTFKTTALQQLTAICSVANGGKLVTPHVVSKIVDAEGKVVLEKGTEEKKRVLSDEVCRTINAILEEGVSGDGGAKNAYVPGYKIAAKTGTSQVRDIRDENGNSYLYVGSCVGYAPSDSPALAVIIVVDQPKCGIYYGSAVAAPYVSAFFAEALPYLGFEPEYSAEEEEKRSVECGLYVGKTVKEAVAEVKAAGLKAEVVGDGNNVVRQIPSAGAKVTKENGKVILYTDGSVGSDTVVPDVTGLTATEAINILISAGFNIDLAGVTDYGKGVGATVISQSPAKGTYAEKGTPVTLMLRYLNATD